MLGAMHTTRWAAAALATGDVGAISDADAEAMRRAGLAHLLSVSGLHITAAVAATMLIVLRLLALSPWLALHTRLPLIAALAGAAADENAPGAVTVGCLGSEVGRETVPHADDLGVHELRLGEHRGGGQHGLHPHRFIDERDVLLGGAEGL